MIDPSKVILVKSYSDFTVRLLSTLDEVPAWQSPRVDSSASVSIRGCLSKTNLDSSWNLEIMNTESDSYIKDNLLFILNQLNQFIAAHPGIKPAHIYLDKFWEVLCFAKEGSKVTTYIPSATRDAKYVALTLPSLSKAIDSARNTVPRTFTYLIGDTLMSCMSSWPVVAVAVMVVNTFLDEYIPSISDVVYKEVTYDGFRLTYNYASKLLGERNAIAEWNIKQMYDKLVERKWMPHIPVAWNQKEIELMKTGEIKRLTDEYTAKIWGVKDPPELDLVPVDDEVDVDSVTEVVETSSEEEKVTLVTLPPFSAENNPFETGFLNLSAITDPKNPAAVELAAVFPHDYYNAILPIILDVPVRFGNLGLKTKRVLACVLDCGVVTFVVKKGTFTLPQLSEVRKRFDELYMTTSIWIDETHRDAINYINLYRNWTKEAT